jgi:hypothetical protein
MIHPMQPKGMQARITQRHFQYGPGSRIAFQNGMDVFFQAHGKPRVTNRA